MITFIWARIGSTFFIDSIKFTLLFPGLGSDNLNVLSHFFVEMGV